MGEACAQVLPAAAEEHLCLVLQSAKGARMDNAVAVALKLGAPLGRSSGWLRPRESALNCAWGASASRSRASSSAQLEGIRGRLNADRVKKGFCGYAAQFVGVEDDLLDDCLLYTSPSPRDS